GIRFSSGQFWLDTLALLALDPFYVSAPTLADAPVEWRLNWGARLSVRGGMNLGRVRPFLQFRAAWFPQSYSLVVDPAGGVANMAQVWLGASLGISYQTVRW